MDTRGILRCAQYAIAPNFYGYCGPGESQNIIDHLHDHIADNELQKILSEFETLFPYLEYIAKENKIHNSFHEKVIEAYWIGNSLLEHCNNDAYIDFINERLMVSQRLNTSSYKKLVGKLKRYKMFPHHTFHVFNLYKKMNIPITKDSLYVMDQCRINWGVVQKINNKDSSIIVLTQKLISTNGLITLKKNDTQIVQIQYKQKKVYKDLKEGDLVSFHWSHICEKLSIEQVKNLELYTRKAIDFYNAK